MAGLLENHDYKDIGSAKKFLSLVENEEKIGELIKDIDNTSNNQNYKKQTKFDIVANCHCYHWFYKHIIL